MTVTSLSSDPRHKLREGVVAQTGRSCEHWHLMGLIPKPSRRHFVDIETPASQPSVDSRFESLVRDGFNK